MTVPANEATSSLSLTKTSITSGYAAAGDTISYDYVVTNTGTTTISGIGVADNLVATVTCPDPTLAPGASETCTGTLHRGPGRRRCRIRKQHRNGIGDEPAGRDRDFELLVGNGLGVGLDLESGARRRRR